MPQDENDRIKRRFVSNKLQTRVMSFVDEEYCPLSEEFQDVANKPIIVKEEDEIRVVDTTGKLSTDRICVANDKLFSFPDNLPYGDNISKSTADEIEEGIKMKTMKGVLQNRRTGVEDEHLSILVKLGDSNVLSRSTKKEIHKVLYVMTAKQNSQKRRLARVWSKSY